MPAPDYSAELTHALESIRVILDSTSPRATSAERLIRIGWVIGSLPMEIRNAIVSEAQNRTIIGWAAGLKPESF